MTIKKSIVSGQVQIRVILTQSEFDAIKDATLSHDSGAGQISAYSPTSNRLEQANRVRYGAFDASLVNLSNTPVRTVSDLAEIARANYNTILDLISRAQFTCGEVTIHPRF